MLNRIEATMVIPTVSQQTRFDFVSNRDFKATLMCVNKDKYVRKIIAHNVQKATKLNLQTIKFGKLAIIFRLFYCAVSQN